MSNYCVMCGSPVPEGQNTCSMCYGDVDHGRDGYYREWLEERDRQEQDKQRIEQLEICDECQHEQDEGVTCSRCGGRTRPVKDGEG